MSASPEIFKKNPQKRCVTEVHAMNDKLHIKTGRISKAGDYDVSHQLSEIAVGFSVPYDRLLSYQCERNFFFYNGEQSVEYMPRSKRHDRGFEMSISLEDTQEFISRCEELIAKRRDCRDLKEFISCAKTIYLEEMNDSENDDIGVTCKL
jgi:hypothetical protein